MNVYVTTFGIIKNSIYSSILTSKNTDYSRFGWSCSFCIFIFLLDIMYVCTDMADRVSFLSSFWLDQSIYLKAKPFFVPSHDANHVRSSRLEHVAVKTNFTDFTLASNHLWKHLRFFSVYCGNCQTFP